MSNLNNGYIGLNNINEENEIQGVVNSRRDYLDKLYKTYKYDPEWVRPSDWLAITDPAPGEQKFVGLFGVSDSSDDANTVNLRFSGNYIVDWGDGSFSSHTSSTIASHSYTYSSLPAGSTTSFGLRQVVITVTPQAGQNLTTVDILETPSGYYQQSIYWLDIVMRIPNCTSLAIGSTAFNLPLLERCRILEIGNVTTAVNTFYRCFKLRVVEFPSTWTPVNISGMFSYCNDLLYAPYINTVNTTVAPSLFFSCSSLKHIPEYNFSSLSNAGNLFAYCFTLESFGDLYIPSSTTTTGLFLNCYSIRSIGNITIGTASNFQQMFEGCYALKKIGNITHSGTITGFYRTFYNCFSLLEIPLFNGSTIDTSNATGTTGTQYIFYSCRSLRSLPTIDLSLATNITGCFYTCESIPEINVITSSSLTRLFQTFYGCSSLKKVTISNTASVTNFNGMFYECRSLISIPAFSFSGVTSSTGIDSNTGSGRMLGNNYGLSSFLGTGVRVSINFQYCKLGRGDIVTVFNNLGTALGTQTINVRNNPGTLNLLAADIAIATGKGWTVLT